MVKLCITERNNLNETLLMNHPDIEMTSNVVDADYLISQSTCQFPEYMYKTIYIGCEAPRTDHRKWCYDNFDKFHTVICHNPNPNKPNQFPMTPDDSAQFYPTRADPNPFITREDTKIRYRGVFYAGMINYFENTSDSHGGINLTPLRLLLGNYNLKEFPGSISKGIGWFGQETKPDNWRSVTKPEAIINSQCDFVLALENTMYPNYLYEKIWDGIATDRVTLYLGDPRIEHHIPTNCFVDLRPYFNFTTREFNVEEYGKRIREMTQEEYDAILNNARKFRETSKGKYRHYMDILTNMLIKRMQDGMATRKG